MFRYKLRTLLIVLALGPPVLAAGYWGWGECAEYRERQRVRAILKTIADGFGGGVQYVPAAPAPPPGE